MTTGLQQATRSTRAVGARLCQRRRRVGEEAGAAARTRPSARQRRQAVTESDASDESDGSEPSDNDELAILMGWLEAVVLGGSRTWVRGVSCCSLPVRGGGDHARSGVYPDVRGGGHLRTVARDDDRVSGGAARRDGRLWAGRAAGLRPPHAPSGTRRPRCRHPQGGCRGDALWVMFLLRLSPLVPYVLLNYALALSGRDVQGLCIGHRRHAAGNRDGRVLREDRRRRECWRPVFPPPRGIEYWTVVGVGLVATIAATSMITRAARRADGAAADRRDARCVPSRIDAQSTRTVGS